RTRVAQVHSGWHGSSRFSICREIGMKLFPKILLGVVAMSFVVGASAQTGTLKKIKDSGTITIGHRDSSIPFSYYDDKQQVIGYSIDICMKAVDAVKAELK